MFAVEDDAAQLIWTDLGPGSVDITCRDHHSVVASGAGPGSVVFDGLTPDTDHTAVFRPESGRPTTRRFRTLSPPPGEEVFRFATVSDLHIGRGHFGFVKFIREGPVEVPHPLRCGRAAIDELLAWGAQHLVIKGDLVDQGRPEQWDDARALLADVPIPVDLIAGNHDNSHPRSVDPWVEADRVGLRLHRDISTVDVPGLRMVLMDSTTRGVDIGRWRHLDDDAAEAVAGAAGAAMLIVHHHPMPLPFPTFLPRGIPALSARPFIRNLVRANPALMGTSGHTHRNRRRDICGVPWSEVGSPKDYPGGWAGYAVHEGGIRQVVRRVERQDCLEWLELTGKAAMGLWRIWSPGTLDDRCFSYTWPKR